MKKRFLSLLLTMTMCLSWLTTGALAADNTGAAESEHDHSAWTEWSSESELPDTSGNYYLSVDVTLSSAWIPPVGETTLCLNGHAIVQSGSEKNVIYMGITLGSTENRDNCSLTITDCNKSTEHKFSENSKTGCWTLNPNGAKTISGGIITNNSNGCSGIYIDAGSLTLQGGTVVGNGGDSNSCFGGGINLNRGTLAIMGASIEHNSARDGGGVYSKSKNITMSSGNISNNTASRSGGGIYAQNGFTMNGGTVSSNFASTGGGISIGSLGETLLLKDGAISGNIASEGGGVYIDIGSKFVMDGGAIVANSALGTLGDGGGVYSNDSFTLNAGTINKNTGGGVCGYLTMNGGKICENTGYGYDGDLNSTFEMTDGLIAKNSLDGVIITDSKSKMTGGSIEENGRYGVIVLRDGSKFDMSGGTASKNEKIGIYVSKGSLLLSGKIDISQNGTQSQNIYLGKDTAFALSGSILNKTPIGISTEIMPTEENPVVLIEYDQNRPLTAADVAHFTSDDPNYYVVKTSEGKMVLTTEKPSLEGTVAISGTPKIGQILTVDTAGVTSTISDNLTYKWYRGDETTPIVGATGSSYTPSEAADVGKTIKVEVSATNQSGVLTSTTTDVVAKADYSGTVNAPSVNSKTDTQVIVNKEAGYEYGVTLKSETSEPASWTMSGIISDLTSNTEYKLWGRVAATDTTEASEAKSFEFTTDKASADSNLQNTLKDAIAAYNAPYDGTAHDAFTVGTLPSGWTVQYADSENGSYSDTMPQVTNVSDSKTLWVKFSNSSYSDFVTSYSVNVRAKDISGVSINLGTPATYNGMEQNIAISSVMDGNTSLIATKDYTIESGNKATNVADTVLKIKGTGNYTGEASTTWKLLQKSINNAILASVDSQPYTGSAITPKPVVTDGSALAENTDFTYSYESHTYVGTATVKITGIGNYTGEKSTTFAITAVNQNPVITDTVTVTKGGNTVDLKSLVTNAEGVVSFEITGNSNGCSISDGVLTSGANTGIVKITVNIAAKDVNSDGKNEYNDYTSSDAINVTVTPTVTAPTAKTGLVYNGANQVLIDAGSVTGGTLQYSLTTGGDYSTELPKAKNAGNYTVYYKVIGNDDYADVAENSISVSIAKRTISVKADNKSMTVNGTLPAFTVSYGNFASDDSEANVIETEATASCKADGTSVGSFPITVSGTTVLKSGMDTNYEIGTPENGTLTVNSQSSSGGGGGGSAVPTYTVSADKSENGTVSISPKSAAKGDTVTVTVTPDKGYVLETLTVLDKNGKEITLTEKNGKYTFTMPAGKVEVKATFMDDNTMLNYFVDVKTGDYYYDAVLWAAGKGITSGTDTTHFSPNASCTRAQIVTFLWRAAGSPKPKSMGSFMDVSADSYYAKAVAWAVEDGITSGTGDGKFSPNATCTREQAVAFLYRSSGSPAVSGGSAFSDVAANAYYADAVAWAEKNEITCGIGGGLFGSGNDCTRGQIVTFLYRTMEKPLSNEMPA